MNQQNRKRAVDVYLQLARATNGYGASDKMTLVGATLSPPSTRRPGAVLVKVRISVPDRAFDPAAIPALVADIPIELLHPAQDEVVVQIEDANPGQEPDHG